MVCRSLKPAQHAGQSLMRCRQDQVMRSQEPASRQSRSLESAPGNAASLASSSRGSDGRAHLSESSLQQQVSPDKAGEAGKQGTQPYSTESLTQPGPSGSQGSTERTGRSPPRASSSRGGGELVSYPLAESPEQSGPDRPARASPATAAQDEDGQSWADTAAIPESPPQEEHFGKFSASPYCEDNTQTDTKADSQPQASSPDAQQRRRSEVGDSAQSPSVDGGHPFVADQQSEPKVHHKAPGPDMRAGIRIESVEWHSRIEKDWYAATVFVDLLTFVYVAFFYQVCLYVI